MNEAEIRKYAELMRELDLTGLEVTENGCVVRLERTPAAPVLPRETVAVPPAPPVPAAAPQEGTTEVTSPMVGVFYAAPAENAEPFVKVGDRVKRGQTLCIVEAMKLMNEIMAELDGEIVEVCVQNGQVVDFGCPLFRIKGFLQGHFPDAPVVPGVILCEILAQSAGILMQDSLTEDTIPMYTSMKNVRFRAPVLPGDLFETKCRITRAKHPFYFAEGEGYVGDTLCVKAEFSFGITEREVCFQRS